MTTNASFDDRLSSWLGRTGHRVPDHLDEVLGSATDAPAEVVVEPRKVAPDGRNAVLRWPRRVSAGSVRPSSWSFALVATAILLASAAEPAPTPSGLPNGVLPFQRG